MSIRIRAMGSVAVIALAIAATAASGQSGAEDFAGTYELRPQQDDTKAVITTLGGGRYKVSVTWGGMSAGGNYNSDGWEGTATAHANVLTIRRQDSPTCTFTFASPLYRMSGCGGGDGTYRRRGGTSSGSSSAGAWAFQPEQTHTGAGAVAFVPARDNPSVLAMIDCDVDGGGQAFLYLGGVKTNGPLTVSAGSATFTTDRNWPVASSTEIRGRSIAYAGGAISHGNLASLMRASEIRITAGRQSFTFSGGGSARAIGQLSCAR